MLSKAVVGRGEAIGDAAGRRGVGGGAVGGGEVGGERASSTPTMMP